MNNSLRPCTISDEWDNPVPAIFHHWGNDVMDADGKLCSKTLAIVELPDGQIKMVEPTDVRFTDR